MEVDMDNPYVIGNQRFGRFPVCAAFYYVIAILLRYTEREAKSLALARAVFFAAAKRGNVGGSKRGDRPPKKLVPGAPDDQPDVDSILFAGVPAYIMYRETEGQEFVALFSDKIQTPEEFDRRVVEAFERVAPGGWEFMTGLVYHVLQDLKPGELNSSRVYRIYERNRDLWRLRETWKPVLQEVA
jgi:hypothetical protein